MSEPAPPVLPIKDAFDAAMAAQQEADAAAARQKELDDKRAFDLETVKRTYDRFGLQQAKQIGKIYGFSAEEVSRYCEPPPPPQPEDEPPHPMDDGGPETPKKPKSFVKALPKDCPVIPIGQSGSSECYYLNPLKEFVVIKKHGPEEIRKLFGSKIDYLWRVFPKFGKDNGGDAPKQTGWKADQVMESLVVSCMLKGVFEPALRLRGVGAWLDQSGGLILHCGDVIWVDGQWREPGIYNDFVYSASQAVPRPLDADKISAEPALALLKLFGHWPWRFGGDDDAPPAPLLINGEAIHPSALLMLGWNAGAMVGGALDWRPMVWLTGRQGSGKSTLQKVVQWLHGGGLLASSDATSAGVYQTVGHSTRPVAIDEAEADPTSLKMKGMIELVRQSSYGGFIMRGSSGGKASGFTARSAFILSSIILPSLNTQDFSRMAILELGTLATIRPPKMVQGEIEALGCALRKRLLEHWPRWADTLEAWRESLGAVGFDARACDQYGTMLAMADMALLDDVADEATRAAWVAPFAYLGEKDRFASNEQTMLGWLLSQPVDNVFRGGTMFTIGSLIRFAAGIEVAEGADGKTCAMILRERGIFVEATGKDMHNMRVTLPNQHAGLAKLFNQSIWGTTASAANSGWQQAVSRLPGALAEKSSKYGRSGRAWSVPVHVFLGMDAKEAAPKAPPLPMMNGVDLADTDGF
jgi:hypothetical protein